MALLLSESDVRRLLDLDALRDAMADALAQYSTGRAKQPLRTVVPLGSRAVMAVMPALVPTNDALGTKIVTLIPANAARGLPTHLATIVMMSAETGELEAILDGRYITEVRTAAVSAVATERLARPAAGTLALIGSGVQAKSHLEALVRIRQLADVRVWSPTREHRERFAETVGAVGPVRATDNAETAVRGADLIVLATSAVEPVLESAWVDDGAHILSVGACLPNQREMDPALVTRARLFVDSRIGAFKEAGDVVMGIRDGLFDESHVIGELGEIVAETVEGRGSPSEVTIFKSLGMAVEDVVTARVVVEAARATGVGQQIRV